MLSESAVAATPYTQLPCLRDSAAAAASALPVRLAIGQQLPHHRVVSASRRRRLRECLQPTWHRASFPVSRTRGIAPPSLSPGPTPSSGVHHQIGLQYAGLPATGLDHQDAGVGNHTAAAVMYVANDLCKQRKFMHMATDLWKQMKDPRRSPSKHPPSTPHDYSHRK